MNIAIVSSVRSGSGWFCSIFDHPRNINLYEFFRKPEDESLDSWKRVCENNIQKKLLKSQQENRHLIIKIMHRHYEQLPQVVNQYLNICDLIIRVHRCNTLQRYISYEKAFQTKIWNKKQQPDFDKNGMKITWNEQLYTEFYNSCLLSHDWVKNCESKKPCVWFTYEKVHEQLRDNRSKLQYVKQQIGAAGFDLHYNPDVSTYFEKENTIKSLAKHFHNPRDFVRSYKTIQKWIY